MAQPPPPKFEPFIPASANLPEFTFRAVFTGALLGLVFGASSLYLVLKVGLTVSASIPVAVISLTLFRALSKVGVRDATILEHNITQTAGSAGESLAFGVGATMPAGRPARHPDDDPAAPRPDREGAWHPEIPGRYRLRRGPEGERR
jgi:hypothetical protein